MTTEVTRDVPVRTAEADMDRLERHLAARRAHDRPLGQTIRAADRERAEAVAARFGYVLRTAPVAEPDAVWAEFRPR